jgi:cytochrome P450
MTPVPPTEPFPTRNRDLPVTRGALSDFSEDPIGCLRELQRRHGDLAALQEGDSRIVFVFGPQWNQRVLSDSETFHAWFFTVRGARNSAQRRLTSGLLSMNGSEHKQHRRMVMGPFQKKSIAGYHEAIVEFGAELLDGWQIGETRDVSRDMTQFMLRVTSGLLFGLGDDVFETAYRIGEKIDRWVQLNHNTGLGAFVSDPRYVRSYDELCGLADELERDIQGLIDRRRRGKLGNDVLSLLIAANDRDGGISDQELIGHVALLFGAAHLTTAHTFTWTLFLLAQHPSVMPELDEEIRESLAGDFPRPDDLSTMPVLDRVLKESMRVLPASGCSHRVSSRPTTLGPFELPKGAPVIFSQYATHHLPRLYPDPEAFRPDRWLEISPSAYEYLPFGAGPRMCIGGPLAMMILKTVLPAILKRYRLSVVPGCEISGNIVSTMLGPTTPVPITVHPADGRFQSVPVSGNVHQMVNLPVAAGAEAAVRRWAA